MIIHKPSFGNALHVDIRKTTERLMSTRNLCYPMALEGLPDFLLVPHVFIIRKKKEQLMAEYGTNFLWSPGYHNDIILKSLP